MLDNDRMKVIREAIQIDQNISTILHNEATDEYIRIAPCLIYGQNYEKALDNPWCRTSHALKQMAEMYDKPSKSV